MTTPVKCWRSTRETVAPRHCTANLPIRSSYFSDPGPATTGIPLPALAYDSMVIEIDIYAMTGSVAR